VSTNSRYTAALIAVIASLTLSISVGCAGAPSRRVGAAAQGSTDRPLLAVSVLNAAASANEIALISGTGRRARIDPHPPLPLDGAWSPDGKRIAFSGYGDNNARGIYVMNPEGTNVRLLFQSPAPSSDEFRPYWSPDGRRLAFVVDTFGPWIIAADGGRPRRLAKVPMEGSTIAWSPDGRTLAFGSSGDGALYTIRTDGTRLRRLTRRQSSDAVDEGAYVGSAAWSPDGRRIAFLQYLDNSAPRLEVVDANGGRPRVVARGYAPAWSPDGRRLVFTSAAGIGVVSWAGRHSRLIANTRGSGHVPVWTTDGTRIVFVSSPSRRVYSVDAKRIGARPRPAEGIHIRLVSDPDQYWSPDGRFLATEGDFYQTSANPPGDEPAHGNAVVRILTPSGVAATFRWSTDDSPAWAPDGGRLAFVRTARTKTIYIIGTRGGHAGALARGHNPIWSPDGRSIAFERLGTVFVVAATGGPARRIAPGHNPTWSPDGRSLAFDDRGVFTAPAKGGQPVQIAAPYTGQYCDLDGERLNYAPEEPAWSHDGRLIAFDGGPEQDCPALTLSVVASDGSFPRHVASGEKPQWTPDDSHLVFLDSGKLAAIGANGTAERILSDHQFGRSFSIVTSFSITSDGRLIAYSRVSCTRGTCTSEIWIARTDRHGRWLVLRNSIDADPAWRPG
jgi:Tol biopolymer transport system component